MLTHELTHLKRRDLAFKALLLVVRAVHWYNPAAWLLARLAGRDLEAAATNRPWPGAGPPTVPPTATRCCAPCRWAACPPFPVVLHLVNGI